MVKLSGMKVLLLYPELFEPYRSGEYDPFYSNERVNSLFEKILDEEALQVWYSSNIYQKKLIIMRLDFTTITQERQDELQVETQNLFAKVINDVGNYNMENTSIAIAEWCNTPEELAMCSIIAGITLKAWGIV